MHGGSQKYAGPDRRQSRPAARGGIEMREIFWFGVALLAAAVIVPVLVGPRLGDLTNRQLIYSLRALTGALFLGGGLLRLARWRLTGEARAGLLGVALVEFGLVASPLAMFAPLISQQHESIVLSPLSRLAAVTCCLVIVARAFSSPPVDTGLRPLRLIAATVLPIWAAFLVLAAVARTRGPVELAPAIWIGAEIALATAWAAAAAWSLREGIRTGRASLTWGGLALGTMAAGELARAHAFTALFPAVDAAVALQLVAAIVVAANAASDLGEIFTVDGNRLLSVTGALEQTERVLASEEERRQEQVHDARSVIAALSAAAVTLERYGDRLDDSTRHELRSSFTRELVRLEHLIDPPRDAAVADFSIEQALAPVLAAERQNGLRIQTRLAPTRARGQADDLATVVQNLLVNARRYAEGSEVLIRSQRHAGDIRIYVEDRGPGVPSAEREAIFRRGVRGAAAEGVEGSGLGLYLARKLMLEQNGALRVTERSGGGASFVLSLPVASDEQPFEQRPDVVGIPDLDGGLLVADADASSLAGLPRQRDDDPSVCRIPAVNDRDGHVRVPRLREQEAT